MEIDLRNIKGEVVRSVEVRDDVFNVPMNSALIHQVMVAQLANRRQGTSKTKTRAQVSGGGAKPRPQKYTGRARQGSIRSPQWKGGGIVFGPSPRSYTQNTPKQVKRQSIKIMLSDKARSQQLIVLENLDLDEAKTKEMAKVLDALEADRQVLLVADGADEAVIRSARNLPKIKTSPVAVLNAVDLLNAKKVVITLDAIRKAEALWGGRFVRVKNGAVLVEVEEVDDADEAESPIAVESVGTVSDEVEPVGEDSAEEDGDAVAEEFSEESDEDEAAEDDSTEEARN